MSKVWSILQNKTHKFSPPLLIFHTCKTHKAESGFLSFFPNHSLRNNVRIVIRSLATRWNILRRRETGAEWRSIRFLSPGKSFLTFGGVPRRTITQKMALAHINIPLQQPGEQAGSESERGAFCLRGINDGCKWLQNCIFQHSNRGCLLCDISANHNSCQAQWVGTELRSFKLKLLDSNRMKYSYFTAL